MKMKMKILSVLLAVCMCFAMAACSSSKKESTDSAAASEASPENAEDAAANATMRVAANNYAVFMSSILGTDISVEVLDDGSVNLFGDFSSFVNTSGETASGENAEASESTSANPEVDYSELSVDRFASFEALYNDLLQRGLINEAGEVIQTKDEYLESLRASASGTESEETDGADESAEPVEEEDFTESSDQIYDSYSDNLSEEGWNQDSSDGRGTSSHSHPVLADESGNQSEADTL